MTPWQRVEPSLSEMLEEPIIRAVMTRDSVHQDELIRLLERMSDAYRATHLARRAH